MGRLRLWSGNGRLDRYLLAVYAAGLAIGVAGLHTAGLRNSTHLILLTLYTAAAAPYLVGLGTSAFLSTAFPFILAAAVYLGPGAAVVTAIAGSISLGLARRSRMSAYKVAFNVANYVMGGVITAFVYRWLGGDPAALASETSLRAFLGAICGFYLVNTFLVSGAVALDKGLPILDVWVEKFQWTAYSFLAGGSFALLVILFLQKAGLFSFLIIFPFCALIYHSWRVYALATGLAGGEREAHPFSRSDSTSTPRGGTGIL